MSDPIDRFQIEIGHEDLADHILDMDADTAESTGPLGEPVTHHSGPGELMCSRGHRRPSATRVRLDEYDALQGVDDPQFEGEPPEGICSYCWSNTIEAIEGRPETTAPEALDQVGEVGYRLRWKQKGRAREEWYDIVVRPDTTMQELDRLVRRFTTIHGHHVRLYGLEGEYMESSINVLPDRQYDVAGFRSHTKASSVTIGEVAERATLWEGDRLTMVNDLGTPTRYYCLVKEVYQPDELATVLDTADPIATTETAAIVKEKRPQ